jgi:histidine triad (HIT) family protein
MPEKTLFSKVIDKEIPAAILFEDDLCVAFKDIHPQAPAHFLVVPRKPIARLSEASSADHAVLGHLMLKAAQVAKEQGLDDFRVVINNGEGAGQTVFHLHLHVLGGRSFHWPPG